MFLKHEKLCVVGILFFKKTVEYLRNEQSTANITRKLCQGLEGACLGRR